jgi:hypothetical protein
MSEAIAKNDFNTEMFFWIDAGLSRFLHFDITDGLFNNDLISKIHNENKIYLQVGKEYEFERVLKNEITLYDAIGKNINFMMAGFWGGNRDLLFEVCNQGENMYTEEYIQKEQVDNEQVLLGFIFEKYRDQLICISPSHIDYINYYIFCNK